MDKILKYLSNNNKSLIPLLVILLVAFLLRLNDLLNDSLWFDEIFSLGIALKSIPQILEATAKDVHPPFYYILLHYWVFIFQDSDIALKLLSVLFSLTSIFLLFTYLRNLFGIRIAVIAGFLLAISNLDITYSIEVRMYSLLSLLTMISMFSFYSYTVKKRIRDLIIYIVATTLMLYTHNFAIFIIFSQVLYFCIITTFIFYNRNTNPTLWVDLTKNKYIRNQIIAFILVLLLFIPWFPKFYSQVLSVNQSFWIQKISLLAFMEVAVEFCGSLLLFALFTMILVYYLIIKNGNFTIIKDSHYFLLIVWLIVPVAIPILLSVSNLTSSIFQIKYLLPSLAPFLIFLSLIFDKIYLNSKKIFFIAIILTFILSLQIYIFNDKSKFKEDWKKIAKFIEINSNNNDIVAIEVSKEFDFIGGSDILIRHYLKKPMIYLNLNSMNDYSKLENLLNTEKNIFLIQRPAKELKAVISSKLSKFHSYNYTSNFKISTKKYCFIEIYENGKYDIYLEKRSESMPISVIKYHKLSNNRLY